jgi:CRISPR system Cascade subunit CasC
MTAKTVELHLLQSFPPSCVNRDGNNSPKDCMFGDVRRARISSQCFKRAIRQTDSFAETMGEAIATRSKQMRDRKLVPHLTAQGIGKEEAEAAADAFRKELAKDDSKKTNLTSVGLYFGDEELLKLFDAHRSGNARWNHAASRVSADVALFGRMLAEATDLNVDAASQVAHAISTHRLSQDMDYWTAADDLKDLTEEDAGAGMLGTAEFNASIFYRYACVSVPILLKNLGEEELAKKAIEAFLLASFEAIPTGKLNGHAHFTPPYFALAVVREKGMPLNLCNAFVTPARGTKDVALDADSANKMLDHLSRSRKMAPVDKATYILAHQLPGQLPAEGLAVVEGYGQLVRRVVESL